MADTEDTQADNTGPEETKSGESTAVAADYDVTIPTPTDSSADEDLQGDTEGAEDPNPASPEPGSDTPPAGDQPAADGAVDEDGVPLRADGSRARDKGEVE